MEDDTLAEQRRRMNVTYARTHTRMHTRTNEGMNEGALVWPKLLTLLNDIFTVFYRC